MKILKFAACFLIAASLTACPAFGEIATEYYSDELFTPLPAVAPLDENSFTVAAKSAILMERTTGEVIFQQNCHEPLAPASITKIMPLLLVMEAIDSGRLTLDTKVTASDYACSMGGSQIWLKPSEVMTVDELLRATVIASANDAVVALGEAVAGSNDVFVRMMNDRAKELGMNDTHFVNATGLDADGHLTSAYDIAVMSRELLGHELIKNYSTVWMDSLRDGKSELVNTNKLVRFYSGGTGLKTGTTSKAGHCLSASAERDGMELVAVVLGASDSATRFSSAKQLLDYGFANYTLLNADVSGQLTEQIAVSHGDRDSVSVIPEKTGRFLTLRSSSSPVYTVDLPASLEAPIAKGQVLGSAKVSVDGVELGEIKLLAGDTVLRLSFATAFLKLLASLFTL